MTTAIHNCWSFYLWRRSSFHDTNLNMSGTPRSRSFCKVQLTTTLLGSAKDGVEIYMPVESYRNGIVELLCPWLHTRQKEISVTVAFRDKHNRDFIQRIVCICQVTLHTRIRCSTSSRCPPCYSNYLLSIMNTLMKYLTLAWMVIPILIFLILLIHVLKILLVILYLFIQNFVWWFIDLGINERMPTE